MLYFLRSTSVLSFHIDIVLTLSIIIRVSYHVANKSPSTPSNYLKWSKGNTLICSAYLADPMPADLMAMQNQKINCQSTNPNCFCVKFVGIGGTTGCRMTTCGATNDAIVGSTDSSSHDMKHKSTWPQYLHEIWPPAPKLRYHASNPRKWFHSPKWPIISGI